MPKGGNIHWNVGNQGCLSKFNGDIGGLLGTLDTFLGVRDLSAWGNVREGGRVLLSGSDVGDGSLALGPAVGGVALHQVMQQRLQCLFVTRKEACALQLIVDLGNVAEEASRVLFRRDETPAMLLNKLVSGLNL